ncbi:MAG: DNA topoisomerase VI subunit B [Phycisphaera sp.]|nr:DNA topoisomerase VI subunit B [Phycisphaera sp.]
MTTETLSKRSPSNRAKGGGSRADAESMAKKQREISVSEFFAKNRHLLGFDNPRKALMTTIKEAVDNALDACEEAGILPNIFVGIEPLNKDTRFRVTVRDNGPGIVRAQVENVFGRLLYGSKFHRLKMSRGQQGIGIAAAGMYGLMTTGKPMVIHTKPKKNGKSHRIVLAIDTQKNKADVSDHEETDYDLIPETGTEVSIELEGKFQRGKQSVDEYLKQTAIANPHARIIYQPPDACVSKTDSNGNGDSGSSMPSLIDDYAHAVQLAESASETTITPGGTVVFPRAIGELPPEPKEIKPHPLGIELGTLIKMLKQTDSTQLGGFLQNEFSRVSLRVANQICAAANKILGKEETITNRTWVSKLGHHEADAIYRAIQETKFMAPPTDCVEPIGVKNLLAGLLKGEKAEFYTATTRPPAVYRGNPFQIEVAIAYGGELGAEEPARVIRFANRVPLLYQQSACAAFKSVGDTTWRNYGMTQPRGGQPVGPMVVMIHMASVWVPFTSESKEAIADYDEIRKEMKLALSECGRKLKTYLSRRARMKREGQRRDVFQRYIKEVAKSLNVIDPKLKVKTLCEQLEEVARQRTVEADMEFDEDGNPIAKPGPGEAFADDDSTVVVESAKPAAMFIDDDDDIDDDAPKAKSKGKKPAPKRKSKSDEDDYDLDQGNLFD